MMIKTEQEKMKGYEEIGSADIAAGLDFARDQILRVLPDFTESFQPAYSVNNFYEPSENTAERTIPARTSQKIQRH